MDKTYPVLQDIAERAWIDAEQYRQMYQASIDDNETFWAEQAGRVDWIKPFSEVKDVSFESEDLHIRWYADGTLNVSANCIDRHLPERADDIAIIWEGDDPGVDRRISYAELYESVCRFANVLLKLGVKKGDRVTIYLPMIPEAAFAMLACARIGAVHSVVFGGFSPEALAGRIMDCASEFVITADAGVRGGRSVSLKRNVDLAASIGQVPELLKTVLVVKNTGDDIDWQPQRDEWLHDHLTTVEANCPPVEMGAEDPLFILYTSGSTGKPKGVLHTTAGYMVWAATTFKYTFDYQV